MISVLSAAAAATRHSTRIWKTIEVGRYKTPTEYRSALKKVGCRVSDWANDILNSPSFFCSGKQRTLKLAVASVGQLGFMEGAYFADICRRGAEVGLGICPAEVGPALRLTYGDQPMSECVRVAMEAIASVDGDSSIFAVERDGVELVLHCTYGHPVFFWGADRRFVFLWPK
jgi:hypothetical protein